MIEKVALPSNGSPFCGEFFPLRDRVIHGALDWERYEHVKVIGHEDKQVNIPITFPLTESNAFNQRLCDFGIA
jgi:hypothetical protein